MLLFIYIRSFLVLMSLAIDIFLENKFHALPVVEDNRLVGIITTHDILSFSVKMPMVEPDD